MYRIKVYTRPKQIRNNNITLTKICWLSIKIVLLSIKIVLSLDEGIAKDWQKLANNKFGGAKLTAILGNFSQSHCFLNSSEYVIIGNKIKNVTNAKNHIIWKNSRGNILESKRPVNVEAVEIPTVGTNQLPYIESRCQLCFFNTYTKNIYIKKNWIKTPIHINIAPIICNGGFLPTPYCQPAKKPPIHIIVMLYVGKNDELNVFFASKNKTLGCKMCLKVINNIIIVETEINGIEIHHAL